MAVTRVALQAALAQLAAGKIFADSNGLLISNAGVKVGSFTRDLTATSGSQAITGVGFKPAAVLFISNKLGTKWMSVGFDDGSISLSVFTFGATAGTFSLITNGISIYYDEADGATSQYAEISSLDSDGFTLGWIKTGSPTGTLTIGYIAFR